MKNVAGYIVCKSDNKSLAPAGEGTGVCLEDFVGPTNLLFWIDDFANEYCRLLHMATGMALDGNGQQVYLHVTNAGDFQKWRFDDAGDGYKKLVHLQSGNVLTGSSDGAVALSGWNNTDNQKWSLAFLGSLVQKATEKLLTRQDDNSVKLSELDNPEQQTFYFEHMGGGDYMVCYKMFTPDMLALSSDAAGHLSLSNWQSLDTQKWQFEDVGDSFQLLVQKSGKVLDGNGSALYMNDENGGDYQLWSPFVRMSVDPSKPYNKVTFAMAHDSHTAKKTSYYQHLSSSPMWEDQTQDVAQQLAGGIRAVRISTGLHNLASDILTPWWRKNVILQHTIALKSFDDYLERVREFLDRNPTAILTIYDEGDSSRSPYNDEDFEGFLAGQYADTFGGTPEAPRRVFIPGVNQMPGLDELKQGNWPTIQAMIEAGIQLIVLMKNGFPKVKNQDGSLRHPWILPSLELLGTNPYDYLIQDDHNNVRPACVDVRPTETLGNKLFKLNHYFYSPIHGKEESSQVLNIWTVGDLLVEDALRAWAVNGQPPNLINVDFYQGVQGAKSHLTHLVRAINSSNTLADLEKKIKGCIIQNTNGLQIGHPYTTDADTPRYKIINKKPAGNGKIYALNLQWSAIANVPSPYAGLGCASLAESAAGNATSQYWYLRYNTPAHGIQLVIAWGLQYMLHHGRLQNLKVASGVPNMTAQTASGGPLNGGNVGQDDTGWEIVYASDTSSYLIRKSGDPSKVLGIVGEPSTGCDIVLVDYSSADLGQQWMFEPVNPAPSPSFLPFGF